LKIIDISIKKIDFLALIASLDGKSWTSIITKQESYVLILQLLYFVLQKNGSFLRKDLIRE
jgi:hypothetical protein